MWRVLSVFPFRHPTASIETPMGIAPFLFLEVNANKGIYVGVVAMSNPADSFQAKLGAVVGIVFGAVIAPLLGFAFGGWHSLDVYLDYEKKSAVVLAAVGAAIGFFLGRIYGTYIAKNKK